MTLPLRQADALLAAAYLSQRGQPITSKAVAALMPGRGIRTRRADTSQFSALLALGKLAGQDLVEAGPRRCRKLTLWTVTAKGRAAVRREAERRTPEVTA